MIQNRTDRMSSEWREIVGEIIIEVTCWRGPQFTLLRVRMRDIRQIASPVPSFLLILMLFKCSLLFQDVAENIIVCPEYTIDFRNIGIDTVLQMNLLKPSSFFTYHQV